MSAREFQSGGGEMGALIRAYDWAAHPLGPPDSWPQGLKTGLRLLLSTGHPMLLWWGEELFQFYNDAYRRSIGPERHPSALGQRGRECWEEIWPIIGPQIERVMSGRGSTWHENQLVPITRHGEREDVYWTYSYGPLDDPDAPNGVGGVLVVTAETTSQVLAEQRMKAAEARWRAHFEQAPGFMCILHGPRHVFEFANPRYFELVGGREILGKRLGEALPEVEDQGFVDLLDHVYASGEPHVGQATPVFLHRGDGVRDRRFLDFVYQPIRDAEGEVTGIFVQGHDVTERVRATEALREEDRRKDEFLAMLAHELRNPLAPIGSVGELLKRSDAHHQALGEVLSRQVRQMTRLVDDLLDISRITRGRIELRRQVFELTRAVELAVETTRALALERGQELVVERGPKGLHVDADLARIVQVLTNVLNNAHKYSPRGARVALSVRAEAGSAVIEVRDEGIGIAPEMVPRVFDLFVQAERTLDRSQGGLGIGLSLAERLVRMHGGRIAVESAGLGEGTRVRIELPPATRQPTAEAARAPARASRGRILVVDDNRDAADLLARLLTSMGRRVESASNALTALERVAAAPPEIVLLDIGLPEMDGYEAARRLRAGGFKGALVAVTGYGRAEDVRRAFEAGFDAHITKPLALAELERVLDELGQG